MPATTTAAAAQAWTLDHDLRVLIQVEARDGEPDDKGTRWGERQRTGNAIAVCSCGYTSGLVDSSTLPPVQELAAEHPPYFMNEQVRSLIG